MNIRIVAACYLLFIGLVIGLSDAGSCGALCAPAKALPYGDKLGHFVLVGLLAWAVFAFMTKRERPVFGFSISVAALAVTLFISCEELSQLWIPARSADWGDLFASYLGIACFEFQRVCCAQGGGASAEAYGTTSKPKGKPGSLGGPYVNGVR